ncbi:MAG TPA: cytochrome c [Anaerolineales bacterium]|nr:cytochrome c [Anaerolineales bacterium]
MSKILVAAGPLAAAALLLAACASRPAPLRPGGTTWGVGSFDSNGERIYFTATSDRGTTITYTGGPTSGMMMGGGHLVCASCHGPNGRGGQHIMHMQTMDAPDIRWSVLSGEMNGEHGGETETESGHGDGDSGYDFDKFRLAVVEGKHPDNTSLSSNMPRWNISDEDLAELVDYLKSLP